MDALFVRLGVPEVVQSFFRGSLNFDNEGLVFLYGNDKEYFSLGAHLVPVTECFWCAGNENYHNVREVIICSSAMEAVGFLSRYFESFKSLDHILLISFGLLPNQSHFMQINTLFKGKKIGLVNGTDLIGRVADVKIAAGICGHFLTANLVGEDLIVINFRRNVYHFKQETLTLNTFEKLTKFRSHMRTYKPKESNSFLEMLVSQKQVSLF